MNKKFIASILAGACAMSMTSIAAFADTVTLPTDATAEVTAWGSDGYFEQKVTVSSSIQTPTLKVTVPTTAAVLVNPYKIAVTVGADTIDDTIISPEYEVKNESNCAIAVTVNASATVKEAGNKDVSIATKPLTGTETKKTAFMYVESTETQGAYRAAGFVDKAPKLSKTPTDAEKASYDETMAYMANQMALTTKETSKVLMNLKAGDTTATQAWFKIQGEAASNTATPWAAKDAIDVALTLKIAPAANGAGTPADPSSFTADVAAADISFGDGAFSLGALTANDTYALTIDSSSYTAAVKPTFTGYTVDSATTTDATVIAITTGLPAAKDKMDVQATGSATITYNLTKTADSSTTSVTFVVTVE